MFVRSINGLEPPLDWQTTGQASCDGGVIVSNDGSDVAIYGHDKP